MKILITAGPTREYIDSVRFLTNGSTGKMGYALAQAAVKAGHKVTLISGPVNLSQPNGLEFVGVVSAEEMYQACMKYFAEIDCVIMTAAVADYRPAERIEGKMSKSPGPLNLQMVRTKDILAELGQKKTHQKLIGFAVQDNDAYAKAEKKFLSKGLDAIILNSPASFGTECSEFAIYDGVSWQELGKTGKNELSGIIITMAEGYIGKVKQG